MDWIKRLNSALDYMEEHLLEKEDIRKIAAAANTSHFHFQRMFAIITDITVAEYIRRRRLTLAAGEIRKGEDILSTALKYGYESQASFTRAFSKMHGLTPAKSREPGARLKAYPPLTFNISITGAHSMEYEIREFESFTIAGVVREFTTIDGANMKEIPLFFQDMDKDGTIKKLMKKTETEGKLKGSLLGVCMDFKDETEKFDFMIGIEPGKESETEGLYRREVPALTWAVFPGEGKMPDAIQLVWKRIFSEWFPSMDYEHADGPELEVYLPGPCEEGECPFEVWIPIKKK
jgi:AraC family transcriptional regulator